MPVRVARLAVFTLLLVAGCAPPLVLHDQTVYVAPRRLAAVPPAIRAFEIDSDSVVTQLPEEARASRARLESSINRNVSLRGGRFFALETMKSLEGGEAFLRWCLRTLHEIEGVSYARSRGRNTAPRGVSDWSYPYDLEPLRASLNADFILVSLFLDGRNTTGRSVANGLARGFGGTSVDAKRRAEACVVDLGDGRVVWCSFTTLQGVDLAQPTAAWAVVEELLRGLYAMSPEQAAQARVINPPRWRPWPGRRPPAPPLAPAGPEPGESDD